MKAILFAAALLALAGCSMIPLGAADGPLEAQVTLVGLDSSRTIHLGDQWPQSLNPVIPGWSCAASNNRLPYLDDKWVRYLNVSVVCSAIGTGLSVATEVTCGVPRRGDRAAGQTATSVLAVLNRDQPEAERDREIYLKCRMAR